MKREAGMKNANIWKLGKQLVKNCQNFQMRKALLIHKKIKMPVIKIRPN